MKLYVDFSTVHLQKETFGPFYIKFHLKNLHKNDLKTTQNPQKQPPGGVLKKAVLKNLAKLAGQHLCRGLFFNKVAGDSITCFSREFLAVLENTCFVTYQGLPLNPQTYNTRFLETTTIATNLETCHKYKFIRRTMLRY